MFFLFWQHHLTYCIHESDAFTPTIHSVIHSANKSHASSVVIFQSANNPAISLKPFCCSCSGSGSNISSAIIPASRSVSINEQACSGVILSSANSLAAWVKSYCSCCFLFISASLHSWPLHSWRVCWTWTSSSTWTSSACFAIGM